MSQSTTKFILILAGIATIGALWYYGAFIHVKLEKTQIGAYNFVYFKRVADYSTSASDWINTVQEMTSTFNKSVAAGIYYDNPYIIEDPSKSRLAMGFIVDDSESGKIQEFLASHPKYSLTVLPQAVSHQTEFPYKNFFSFTVLLYKVYPVIEEHFKITRQPFNGILEIYKFGSPEQPQKIIFNTPEAKEYFLF